jgi:hypothetical protein
MTLAFALATLLLMTGSPQRAGTPAQPAPGVEAPSMPPGPGVRPDDVGSLEAILSALYDVISGPAGQRRDWDRMRSLFAPGARLIPAVYRPDSAPSLRVWSVEEYITQVGPRLETGGFFEREIARRTERYGGVTHVFSTYESRRTSADVLPFARGINSIQLFFDARRWWIVTIFWEGERTDNPIPGPYLKSPGG